MIVLTLVGSLFYILESILIIWKPCPLRRLTDQTTEATISKVGLSVLYSIKTKMRIIKSVLIKGFLFKKKPLFFSITISFVS